MKSVLISIQPYWVFLIIAQKMGWDYPACKTIEVRKNYPQDEAWDKTVKIYCSKNPESFKRIPERFRFLMEPYMGKIIGEFVCDKITTAEYGCYYKLATPETQISASELMKYANDKPVYGWHINNLKIYDTPKKLSEFNKPCTASDIPVDCRSCRFYFAGTDFAEPRCKDGERVVKRPPQSWSYISTEF